MFEVKSVFGRTEDNFYHSVNNSVEFCNKEIQGQFHLLNSFMEHFHRKTTFGTETSQEYRLNEV